MALATAADLALYMHQTLDTPTANLVLDLASAIFEREADTKFASTSATYTLEGCGQDMIMLPKRPVVSVTSVTVDGSPITDYTRVNATLYRVGGFGVPNPYPVSVVVTYNYGYTSVPDDVRGAVLEMAAVAYGNPNVATREQIDDYMIQYSSGSGGIGVTDNAMRIAGYYRVGAIA